MGGYQPSSFFAFVAVHEHTKKEQGRYPSILNEKALSTKDLLHGIKHQKNGVLTI